MPGVKGKSGPRHLPTATKELRGTLRADQQNPDEPMVTALTELPKAPSYLSAMSKTAWRRIGAELVDMTVLTSADLTALEAYCVLYAHWRHAEAKLKKSMVMDGRNGIVLSPYVRISKDCLKEMKSWMLEFGLTPSSRSRVRVKRPAEAGETDTEDWFNDHKN